MSTTLQNISVPTPPTISPNARKLIVAILVSLLTGAGLLENMQAVIVVLTTGAAGAVGSFMVDWVRVWLYPWATMVHAGFTGKVARFVSTALYTKRGVRFTVLVLSLLIGAAATAAGSMLAGQQFNIIVGAAWTYLGTQLAHMLSLPTAEEQHTIDQALDLAENALKGDVPTIAAVINTMDTADQKALTDHVPALTLTDPPKE